jgi:high-affinity iron transporter
MRIVVAVCATGVLSLAACGQRGDEVRSTSSRKEAALAAGPITVTDTDCAPGWVPPASGQTTFSVTNNSTQTDGIELVGLDDRHVYAHIEVLPPGVTRPVIAQLPPATYLWKCAYADGTFKKSETADVTGPAAPGLSYLPVGQNELLTPLVNFRAAIGTGLTKLQSSTDALDYAAHAGVTTTKLKAYWLAAHLDYERLGGAYGLFGDYDDKINGKVDGRPGGSADPGWTGFHRLEYAIWHGQSTATIRQVADVLTVNVHLLKGAFPIETDNANDLVIRAHEILENALQFELTAKTDYGSHTNLATVRANIDGTRTAITAITPMLTKRDKALLDKANADLTALAASVDRFKKKDGTWYGLLDLRRSQRQQINAAMTKTVEDLSTIPDILHLDKHADE